MLSNFSSAASVVFPLMLSDSKQRDAGKSALSGRTPSVGAELRAAGMREGWKLQRECVCCNEKQTRRSPSAAVVAHRFGFRCRQQNHEYLNGKRLPLNINQKLIDSITDLIFEMFDQQQLLMRGRIPPVASAAMWIASALKTAPGW